MKPIMLQLTSIFIFISLYGLLFRSSNQNHPKAYGFSSIGDVTHVTQAKCDMCDILSHMLIPLEMHDFGLFFTNLVITIPKKSQLQGFQGQKATKMIFNKIHFL